jgi:hypothetical protein
MGIPVSPWQLPLVRVGMSKWCVKIEAGQKSAESFGVERVRCLSTYSRVLATLSVDNMSLGLSKEHGDLYIPPMQAWQSWA